MHLWTLAEANRALPEVRRRLAEARRLMDALADVDDNLEDLQIVGQGDGEEAREYLMRRADLMEEFEQTLTAFHGLGCEVKDVRQGLVDFRGELGGKVVYLCWRDGEDAVTHWHSLDSGYAGRKPIPTA